MHDTHPRPVPRTGPPRLCASGHERGAVERPRRRRRVGLGALAALALLATPFLSAPAAASDGALGDAQEHVAPYPGSGTLALGPPGAGVDALLLDTRLELDVRGLLGELTLTQTFRNTTDRWLDGRYLFPLPPEAAVRGLELRVGERVVVGRVQRRDTARATFERARAAGQVAGLVEQQRPNLFTARLASIAPGAEIRVALDVLLPVTASDERLSLTLPTTLTPRYANAHADDAAAVSGPILPRTAIRGPRFSLAARLRPLADPSLASSDTHRLETDGERLLVTDAAMDRDVVLAWPYAEGAAPASEIYLASHRGERYAQLHVAPPAAVDGPVLPRELVLVVDTSGSMAGLSIRAARAALQSALDGLRPADSFELVAFDDAPRSLFGGARAASADNVAAARRFVRALEADGGTEMGPALARALALAPATDAEAADAAETGDTVAGDTPGARTDATERLRQIVFLTDGSIADEARLLATIRRGIGRARLFTIGIGSAPNGWFLDKAAEAGRGRALAIRDVDDVQSAVADLLGRLERPVLTDIEVQFPGGRAESYPARVPDLYADSPLTVVARLDDAATEAIVTGWQGDERFVRRIALARASDPTGPDPTERAGLEADVNLPPPTSPTADGNGTADAERGAGAPSERAPSAASGERVGSAERNGSTERVAPALAMHWARAKVAALLDEQRESGDGERHRERITELALDVGLVTPYTSFVAVEESRSRPTAAAPADADVANLLPHGNEMTTFAMPRGAAGIDTLALVGTLLALAGSLLLRLGRRLGRARAPAADAAA